MLKITDLKIGDSKEFKVDLDEKSHEYFKKFIGDYSPVHIDDEFAKLVGYNKKLAYGFHVTSYLSRLYGEYLPGGGSVCVTQSIKYLKPVYLNQEIIVRGTITNKNEIFDKKGGTCITGEALLKMII